jgi:hypothetical protein
MKINGEKVPQREGYETIIHVCSHCEFYEECEGDDKKDKGWCYTYEKE